MQGTKRSIAIAPSIRRLGRHRLRFYVLLLVVVLLYGPRSLFFSLITASASPPLPAQPMAGAARGVSAAITAAAACGIILALLRRLRILELQAKDEAAGRQAEARRKGELALQLMTTRNRLMHSAESLEKGRKFVPAPSDVCSSRSATWNCQLCEASWPTFTSLFRTRCS